MNGPTGWNVRYAGQHGEQITLRIHTGSYHTGKLEADRLAALLVNYRNATPTASVEIWHSGQYQGRVWMNGTELTNTRIEKETSK